MVNINIFGGPGTGKSTTASGLFYQMKNENYKVEYIQEFAKELTFAKDTTRISDQLLILGEQHHRLFRLKHQVDYVIHDSPFVMGLTYAKDDTFLPQKEFKELILKLFFNYKNINIFLERNIDEHGYQEYGRKQTLEESINKDNEIKQMLSDNDIPYIVIRIDKNTVDNIKEEIKKINQQVDSVATSNIQNVDNL